MKFFVLILLFSFQTFSAPLVVDVLEEGCGWSDLVYADIASKLSEKSVNNISIKSKGEETGRRLFLFSDRSWFLTLEYFSIESTDRDVSCIVAKGPGETTEDALSYIMKELPPWKWGAILPKALRPL